MGTAHLGEEQPREVVLATLEGGLQITHLLGLAGQPESQQRVTLEAPETVGIEADLLVRCIRGEPGKTQ